MGTIKQNFANNVETGGTFDAQDLTGTIPAANIANSSLSDITTEVGMEPVGLKLVT